MRPITDTVCDIADGAFADTLTKADAGTDQRLSGADEDCLAGMVRSVALAAWWPFTAGVLALRKVSQERDQADDLGLAASARICAWAGPTA